MKKEIAKIYHEFIQDHEKARKFYDEALEIYENENHLKESADILNNLGEIYKNEQNIALALTSFKKAMQYYSEIKDESNKLILSQKVDSLDVVSH
jgi:tetratricopeptide (TPR) repeat protein